MAETILVKLGELTLKGGNREGFELILRRNMLAQSYQPPKCVMSQ